MSRMFVLREFIAYFRRRKTWWLLPLAVILLILSAVVVFAQGSALAPFIYTLF